jgi:hypothetical protein
MTFIYLITNIGFRLTIEMYTFLYHIYFNQSCLQNVFKVKIKWIECIELTHQTNYLKYQILSFNITQINNWIIHI